MTLKVLDLFSGIGGFSLGLERAGMETVAFCEIEDYPRKVLKKHWPDVPIYRDVRKLNKEVLENDGIRAINVICGGFPCQPFSVAGKQRGKEDDRHLWPEMLRLIREIKPTWIIGENVAGFVSMALDDVLSDLEGEGYTCQAFVIPACAVNAIHRRDRVWIVAYSESKPGNGSSVVRKFSKSRKPEFGNNNSSMVEGGGNANTNGNRRQERSNEYENDSGQAGGIKEGNKTIGEIEQGFDRHGFRPIGVPSKPPVRYRDDGLPDNVARLKALGNAVVPQIPELIGRAIIANG